MRKKYLLLVPLCCFGLIHAQVTTENAPTAAPSSKDGQNKFAIFGNGEMTFVATKDNAQFGDVNFKPIFLWKMSDQLFVEAEVEFETGEGSLDIGLEYLNMVLPQTSTLRCMRAGFYQSLALIVVASVKVFQSLRHRSGWVRRRRDWCYE